MIPVPLMVAGGGGGLGLGRYLDSDVQQARGFMPERGDTSGTTLNPVRSGEKFAGAGGGWRPLTEFQSSPQHGLSLLEGSYGGRACYEDFGGNFINIDYCCIKMKT